MIELKDVSLIYPNGKKALDCISFKLEEYSRCAVLGANGAGKSTLLWTIMGILEKSSGEILLDKIPVEKQNATQIRKIASVVFQNSDDQLFFPTVIEDVIFGMVNSGIDENIAIKKAESLLEEFGILHLKDRQNQYLSDGEKKKVAICASLACNPKILMFDEPSALLDPKSKRETSNIINGLGKTILLTTHDLDFALKTCPLCIILKESKLVAFGKTCELLQNQTLLENCNLY